MKVVIKLTGKLFSANDSNIKVISEIGSAIRYRYELGDKVAVICGGGEVARKYIEIGEKLRLSKSMLDLLGIESSKLNALLMASLLSDISYLPIPSSVSEFLRAWSTGKVVVIGGLQPGQSTNAVAAIIAELVNADLLVNATVVDGIYDKDPRKYPNAKLLSKVNINKLRELINQEFLPGHYELIDPLALNVLQRSKIRAVFINAFKPRNLYEVLNGRENIGTWITYE